MGSKKSFGTNTNKGKSKTSAVTWFHWAAMAFRQWQADEEAAWHRFLADLPDLARACSRLTLGLGGLVSPGSDGRFIVGVSVLMQLARCSRSVMYKSLRAFDDDIARDRDDPDPVLYPLRPGSWKSGKQAQWVVRRLMPLNEEVARFYLGEPVQIEQVKPVQTEQVPVSTCSNRDLKEPQGFPQKTSSSSETTPPTKPVVVDGVAGLDSEHVAAQEIEPLLTEGMQRLVVRLGSLREAIRLNPAGARKAVSSLEPEEVECLRTVGVEFWEDQAKQIQARPIRTTLKRVLYSRISDPILRQDLLMEAKQWASNRRNAFLAGRVTPEGMTLSEAWAQYRAEKAKVPDKESTGYSAAIKAEDEAWGAVLGAVKAHHPSEYQSVESDVILVLRATSMQEGSGPWNWGFNNHLKTRISELLPRLLHDAS
jgi:hypothetical protein